MRKMNRWCHRASKQMELTRAAYVLGLVHSWCQRDLVCSTVRGSWARVSGFKRKGSGFYSTHPSGKVSVRTISMVANVPVTSGASTLVRCEAVRACLVNGVDMAAPEERHSRVGLRAVVYPGFSPQNGERLRWGETSPAELKRMRDSRYRAAILPYLLSIGWLQCWTLLEDNLNPSAVSGLAPD